MKNSRFVKIGLLILILVFAIGLSLWIGIDFAIRTLCFGVISCDKR